MRRVAIVILAVNFLLYAAVVASGKFPYDALGTIVLPDFLGHYTGGQLFVSGRRAQLYDLQAQDALEFAIIHDPRSVDLFLSPPLAACLYAPFALLPYALAAAAWGLVSVALLVASGLLLVRLTPSLSGEDKQLLLLLAAASQPVILLLGSGQDTCLSLFLWIAGTLLSLKKRDGASGLVFSMGLFKPQLFLLPPLLFGLLRKKRALGAWLAGAAAQASLSLGLFGWSGLRGWWGLVRSPEYLALRSQKAFQMASVPPLVQWLLPPPWQPLATGVGATLAVALVAGTFFRLWRGQTGGVLDERAAWALACLATVLASPHLFAYDLALVLLPSALMLESFGGQRAARGPLIALFLLTWTAPLRVALAAAHWPLSALAVSWAVVPVFFLWKRIPTHLREDAQLVN